MDPSTAAIIAALLALVASIVAPVTVTMLTGRQRHRDQRADWARQDEVAARLEAKQQEAADAAEAVKAALMTSEARAVAAGEVIGGKLEQIHILVNAKMTAAIEEQLSATEAQAVLLREVAALNLAAGREPSPDSVAVLSAVERRVAELRAQVADRALQTAVANDVAAGMVPSPEQAA